MKLTAPRRDGTTHLVKSPLEFMQRLTARVPRPGLHLIRFHDVLTPSAKLRAPVAAAGEKGRGAARPVSEPDEPQDPHRRASCTSWARQLKREFEIDMEQCPNCGDELKIIAAILEPPDIEPILEQLGLPTPGGSGVNRSEGPLAFAPDGDFSRNHAALRQGRECRRTVPNRGPDPLPATAGHGPV